MTLEVTGSATEGAMQSLSIIAVRLLRRRLRLRFLEALQSQGVDLGRCFEVHESIVDLNVMFVPKGDMIVDKTEQF